MAPGPLRVIDTTEQCNMPDTNSNSDLLKSLDAPERNKRLESIDSRSPCTFEWVYRDPAINFTQWLREGTGIFWIRGKPGSGKSTLMEFIFRDKRTWEFLHDWKSVALQIQASFFFHHRGSLLQKSLEGLLRSVLYQIIEQQPELATLLGSAFSQRLPSEWTLRNLEKSLRVILQQQTFSLDICFFFDALDEYDGAPEFISRLLADLVNATNSSQVRIKICFSSRPWDVFMDHFGHCPGFEMHNLTETDMHEFCLELIRVNGTSRAEILLDLVPDIVSRAQGVFLWVKLVMGDLIHETNSGSQRADLESTLKALPVDLSDYYSTVIGRIKPDTLRETYAVLEIISKKSLNAIETLIAVESASCLTFNECVRKVKRLWPEICLGPVENMYELGINIISNPPLSNSGLESLKRRLLENTGGLVEWVDSSRGGYFQLMHQTVKDFVDQPQFKGIVLGKRADSINENGYSFLAKLFILISGHFIMTTKVTRRAMHHARMAENTTGNSQFRFLRSVPGTVFNQMFVPLTITQMESILKSALGFAVAAGLYLYLESSLSEDPHLLQESNEPLHSLACSESNGPETVTMSRFLLRNRYQVMQDAEAFPNLVRWMSYDDQGPNNLKLAMKLAVLLLTHGQDPNVDICAPQKSSFPNSITSLMTKAPHICPLELLKYLLGHGIGPNVLDGAGRTPLDFVVILLRLKIERGSAIVIQSCYDKLCFLIEQGGLFNTTLRKVWQSCLEKLFSRGFEVDQLRERFNKMKQD